MNVARTAAEVLAEHTTLELECIDRMYLNVYVPMLQSGAGAAYFFRRIRGNPVPSSALMGPMTRRFVAAIERHAAAEGVDLVRFERFERKDDRTREYLRDFAGTEGLLYIGKAQEKARVVRTERRDDPVRGPYPWLASSTAMVNHYYVYLVDEDFGPLFIKFCSYFPYNAKLCVNGHEYLKCQLAKEGIAFEALDNGVLSCADPARMRRIAAGLDAAKIDALLRKWLARLPHPFTVADRKAGIRYDVSVLQAEFALTQVHDRPVQGRVFFEQVMRENLDLGRPDHVQLIFDRRVTRRTPSRLPADVHGGLQPALRGGAAQPLGRAPGGAARRTRAGPDPVRAACAEGDEEPVDQLRGAQLPGHGPRQGLPAARCRGDGVQGLRRRGDGAARRTGASGTAARRRRGSAPVEDEKSVRLRVDRAKAEQRSRPAWKPPPDHPWRRAFKPEADGVAAGLRRPAAAGAWPRSLRSLGPSAGSGGKAPPRTR